MSRIAYIISAYKDAQHLLRLVNRLNENADFYIHVDLRTDIKPFLELLRDKVTFVPRHWISWGGWEQVEYQKELLGAVINSGKEYGHIVCISGQDYPLWNNSQIHHFFNQNKNKEFISGYNLTRSSCKKQKQRFINYHFFRDLRCNNLWIKNKLIVLSRHVMRLLPIRKKSTIHIKKSSYEIYCGSDYWALTLPCAKYVYQMLCNEQKFKDYFYHSFVPSELCIQTIVFNSPFASNAILHKGEYPGLAKLTPLHYINYGKCIKILTEEDYITLKKSGKMFCRKVVYNVSDKLVQLINYSRISEGY